ncbi:MAG: PilZ domain-containing protein [Bdellovibrionales bacterium]
MWIGLIMFLRSSRRTQLWTSIFGAKKCRSDFMGGAERRRFPRRFFKRTVGVFSQGKYHSAIGVEIGEGGMMFSLDHSISEAHQILVNLRIPNHGFVVIRATIKNTNHRDEKYRYGIQFFDLDFQNRRRIRDFIAEKTELEAIQEKSENSQNEKALSHNLLSA